MGWPDVNYADIWPEVHIKNIWTGREGHLPVSSCRAVNWRQQPFVCGLVPGLRQPDGFVAKSQRQGTTKAPAPMRGAEGPVLFSSWGKKLGALPSSTVAAGGADRRRLPLAGAEMDGQACPRKAKTAF